MDKETRARRTRENRLRRAAERQGLVITKSRRRDPRALDFGLYWVSRVDTPGGGWRSRENVGDPNGMTLDEVEAYIDRGSSRERRDDADPEHAAAA